MSAKSTLFSKLFESPAAILTRGRTWPWVNISCHSDRESKSLLLVHWFSTNLPALSCLQELSVPRKTGLASCKASCAVSLQRSKIFTTPIINLRSTFKRYYMPSSHLHHHHSHGWTPTGCKLLSCLLVFPSGALEEVPLVRKGRACSDPKLMKWQSLGRSPGWVLSKTYDFIMFCFIA